MPGKMEGWQLLQMQSLPLSAKVIRFKNTIREFYEYMDGEVYIAFSGGKDSAVLKHLIHSVYPYVPSLFIDTGMEFQEIRMFVKQHENVDWYRPEMAHQNVLKTCGYPVVSKENALKIRQAQTLPHDGITYKLRMEGIKSNGEYSQIGKIPEKWKFLVDAPFQISEKCCDIMKKKPFKKYERKTGRKPYIGNMASNSRQRKRAYLKQGCNNYTGRIQSNPLGIWLEQDIWEYIKKFNVPYSSIYDMGYDRTGCIFCMFGCDQESAPNRFQKLALTHPKQYSYCINTLGLGSVLDYMGVDFMPTEAVIA